MNRRLPFFGAALALGVLTMSGCVDRRFVIDSDPPGANVYMNGKLIGATPLDQSFTYYGKYRFVFVRDGYETMTVDEQVATPWWEYFPLEFVVENLWPWTIRDVRYIPGRPDPTHYGPPPLQPIQLFPPELIRQRADQLRAEGQSIGTPLAQTGPPVVILPPGGVVPETTPVIALPPAAGPGTPVPVVPR